MIFGAQAIALGTYIALHNLFPTRNIRCFLVTKRENNAKYLCGLPVLELASFSRSLSEKDREEIEILIATPEDIMSTIEKRLDEEGLPCHVRLTSERFNVLQSFSNVCDKRFVPVAALPIGYHRANLHVFMARFYKDKKLVNKYSIPDWITSIQVGASLCKERVANILDNEGENISYKNGNYSELTALYWIWKNRLVKSWSENINEYFGLCHYRRILNLSDDDILRLTDNEVDVILPFPMPYEPDIEEHHRRYLKEEDWESLLIALQELQPGYVAQFKDILKQQYLYNYNIMIAKKQVMADYCEWLFPILCRVEELSTPKGFDRSDRYIGYMGETLTTLYFMANKEQLNIMHAGCKFLV